MESLLRNLEYWHWWVLAIVLLFFEMFAPGVFFLWLGFAAGVVGLWLYVQPDLGWQSQFIIFAILSVLTAVFGRWWVARHPIATDQPQFNRRGEQYLDRVFTLDEAVVNEVGKLRVDDTIWKIHGPDCAAGGLVRVIGVDGVVLRIECVDASAVEG